MTWEIGLLLGYMVKIIKYIDILKQQDTKIINWSDFAYFDFLLQKMDLDMLMNML